MTQVNLSMSISADGFVAGPNQSEDNPLGEGGLALHAWHLGDQAEHPVNKQVADEMMEGFGAFIMGRNMYGPIRGEWGDTDWKGWWGDDPPYHAPTYVLTHHAHDPIEMEGGTTFHFVTDGLESAFAQARETAGDKKVSIAGGASCAQQALAAGARRRGRSSGFPGHPRRGRETARQLRARLGAGARAGAGPRGAGRRAPPVPRDLVSPPPISTPCSPDRRWWRPIALANLRPACAPL